MDGIDTSGKPKFLWQGILILLPLVVLVFIGFGSLRQEAARVETEARQRCSEMAQGLAESLSRDLCDTARQVASAPQTKLDDHNPLHDRLTREWVLEDDLSKNTLTVDSNGNLAGIPSVSETTPNPLLPAQLSREQAQLWNAARNAQFVENDPKTALDAYQRFIDLKPNSRFELNAQYAMALLLAAQSQTNAAIQILREIENAAITTESGIPLGILAQLQRARLQADSSGATLKKPEFISLLGLICSNSISRPTTVTPLILDSVAELESKTKIAGTPSQEWLSVWRYQEAARGFYGTIKDQLISRNKPCAFWAQWNEQPWLVLLTPTADGALQVSAFRELLLQGAAWEKAIRSQTPVPAYAEIEIKMAGRTLMTPKNDGPVLGSGSAALIVGTGGTDTVTVTFHLSDPKPLYAAQRQRQLWFAGLVSASALAALFGLVASWRGFNQQLRLNELKSNFVSSVSHELRAPIASIRLMAEGLDRGKIVEPQKQREYFRFIVQECRRLSSLIENVLDFSRIEQGRKKYKFEPADVRCLVEQTIKLMIPYAIDRQVTLTPQLPSEDSAAYTAHCDGYAVQQALVNLIDNAVKHSAPGTAVTIALESGVLSRPGRDLQAGEILAALIWVEDHGPGIPREEHEKIFERFYRRGSELRRETQGIGIGLSLVKHIVEAHGGCVKIRSEVGGGSRFTIELPLAPKEIENGNN